MSGRVYVDTLAQAVRDGFGLADARDMAEAEAERARAESGRNREVLRNYIPLAHNELRGPAVFSANKP